MEVLKDLAEESHIPCERDTDSVMPFTSQLASLIIKHKLSFCFHSLFDLMEKYIHFVKFCNPYRRPCLKFVCKFLLACDKKLLMSSFAAKADISVKTEAPSPGKACSYDERIKGTLFPV